MGTGKPGGGVRMAMDHHGRLRAQQRLKLGGRLAAAFLLVVLVTGIAACVQRGASPGATTTPAGPDLQNLDGTTWRATLIRDAAPIAGAEPTMRFEGGQAGGTTGCNTYGGAYDVGPAGEFRIDSMIMTEMACDGPHGNQEATVIEILSAADRIEVLADGQIRISGTNGAITFAEDPR